MSSALPTVSRGSAHQQGVCSECDEAVWEDQQAFRLTIGGVKVFFHSQHFRCHSCQVDLKDISVFTTPEGRCVCGACSQHLRPTCGYCDKKIEGSHIKALNKVWHAEHFVCAICQTNLCSAPFVGSPPPEGKPLCEPCHHAKFSAKCYTCNLPLSTKFLMALGRQYHHECLQCCKGHPLEDGAYYPHRGEVYCRPHYEEQVLPQCDLCEVTITDQMVRTKQNRPFHPECWEWVKLNPDWQREEEDEDDGISHPLIEEAVDTAAKCTGVSQEELARLEQDYQAQVRQQQELGRQEVDIDFLLDQMSEVRAAVQTRGAGLDSNSLPLRPHRSTSTSDHFAGGPRKAPPPRTPPVSPLVKGLQGGDAALDEDSGSHKSSGPRSVGLPPRRDSSPADKVLRRLKEGLDVAPLSLGEQSRSAGDLTATISPLAPRPRKRGSTSPKNPPPPRPAPRSGPGDGDCSPPPAHEEALTPLSASIRRQAAGVPSRSPPVRPEGARAAEAARQGDAHTLPPDQPRPAAAACPPSPRPPSSPPSSNASPSLLPLPHAPVLAPLIPLTPPTAQRSLVPAASAHNPFRRRSDGGDRRHDRAPNHGLDHTPEAAVPSPLPSPRALPRPEAPPSGSDAPPIEDDIPPPPADVLPPADVPPPPADVPPPPPEGPGKPREAAGGSPPPPPPAPDAQGDEDPPPPPSILPSRSSSSEDNHTFFPKMLDKFKKRANSIFRGDGRQGGARGSELLPSLQAWPEEAGAAVTRPKSAAPKLQKMGSKDDVAQAGDAAEVVGGIRGAEQRKSGMARHSTESGAETAKRSSLIARVAPRSSLFAKSNHAASLFQLLKSRADQLQEAKSEDLVTATTDARQGGKQLQLAQVLGLPPYKSVLEVFLEQSMCKENMDFLTTVQQYRACASDTPSDNKANAELIWSTFLDNRAPFTANVDAFTRHTIESRLKRGDSAKDIFNDAFGVVYVMTSRDVYTRFLRSSDYSQMIEDPAFSLQVFAKSARRKSWSILPQQEDYYLLDMLALIIITQAPTKTMRLSMKKFDHCMEGAKMVDFLVSNKRAQSRIEAISLLQRMLEVGLLRPITAGQTNRFTGTDDCTYRVRARAEIGRRWPSHGRIPATFASHLPWKGTYQHRSWGILAPVLKKIFLYRTASCEHPILAVQLQDAVCTLNWPADNTQLGRTMSAPGSTADDSPVDMRFFDSRYLVINDVRSGEEFKFKFSPEEKNLAELWVTNLKAMPDLKVVQAEVVIGYEARDAHLAGK